MCLFVDATIARAWTRGHHSDPAPVCQLSNTGGCQIDCDALIRDLRGTLSLTLSLSLSLSLALTLTLTLSPTLTPRRIASRGATASELIPRTPAHVVGPAGRWGAPWEIARLVVRRRTHPAQTGDQGDPCAPA